MQYSRRPPPPKKKKLCFLYMYTYVHLHFFHGVNIHITDDLSNDILHHHQVARYAAPTWALEDLDAPIGQPTFVSAALHQRDTCLVIENRMLGLETGVFVSKSCMKDVFGSEKTGTVDGRNPAPPRMYKTL